MNSDPHSGNSPEKQGISGAPLHLLVERSTCRCAKKEGQPVKCKCFPNVVVENRGTNSLVTLRNRPWSWPDCDKVFLHLPLKTKSIGAERYARQLQQKIAAAAWKEHERRERIKEAKRREGEAGL